MRIRFPYPFGHSSELEWGSFVYIFGYPMGGPDFLEFYSRHRDDLIREGYDLDPFFKPYENEMVK